MTDTFKSEGVAVVGCCFMDYKSYVGASSISCHGGVGRNVAEGIARFGVRTTLFTMANPGKQPAAIYQHLSGLGIRLVLTETECGVGEFRAHVDQIGQLVSSAAVLPRIEALTWNFIKSKIDWLGGAKWIVIETGLSEDMLLALLDFADQYGISVCGLPTRLHHVGPRMHILGRLTCLLLSQREASFILGNPIGTVAQTMDAVRLFSAAGVCSVVVSMGEHGIVAANDGETPLFFRALPAKVQDPVGAGDAFAAGVVGSLARGYPFTVAVFCGLSMARQAVETRASVAGRDGY